jgi:hypothetical protein
MTLAKFLRHYSLGIVLALLFFVLAFVAVVGISFLIVIGVLIWIAG